MVDGRQRTPDCRRLMFVDLGSNARSYSRDECCRDQKKSMNAKLVGLPGQMTDER